MSEYGAKWLKEHRQYILSMFGRAKQTAPIDSYHIDYRNPESRKRQRDKT